MRLRRPQAICGAGRYRTEVRMTDTAPSIRRGRPGRRLLLAIVVAATSTVFAMPGPTAEAASMSFTFLNGGGGTYGSIGTIGIDAIYGGSGGGGNYDARYLWRPDGG